MIILEKILKDKIAKISLIVITTLYLLIILSDFISPYNPNTRNPKGSYLPPSKIYFLESGMIFSPFIYKTTSTFNEETFTKKIIEDKNTKYFIKFFVKGEEYKILNLIPCSVHLFGTNGEQRIYLFGTDRNGRDIFSRILHGGKPSLTIGFVGLLIVFPLGLLYGGVSGYFGGAIDNFMMRIAEAIMSLPYFYLIVVLASILPTNISNSQRFLLITIILSFVSWAGLSRVIRGQVLSIKEEEYILAAKAIGINDLKIIIKHIIPQTTSYIIIAATLSIPGFIIGESALSFLGMGITQPDPSWGNILAEGKELSNMLLRPWILLLPAACIFVSVLCFNLVGDKLRDILDPRS
ncbi:MAG: ABC transporter permease [Candidatus Melainabacteria bacterium]|nr:ABC transporter permease [Candidatus Melainabacteria bacterium]